MKFQTSKVQSSKFFLSLSSPFSCLGLYLRYTFVADSVRGPGPQPSTAVHFCGCSGPDPEPMCDMLRLVCGGLVGGWVGRWVGRWVGVWAQN